MKLSSARIAEKAFYLAVFIGLQQASLGSGSFQLDDITPLLKQQPELAERLTRVLETAQTGEAARLGPSTPKLAGYRIAPYSIEAKPKGEQGPFTILLVIEADTKYIDGKGKPVAMTRGVAIKEKLQMVWLAPLPLTQLSESDDSSLRQAMQEYVRSIRQRDTAAFLKLVPRALPFFFASYDLDSLKRGYVASVDADSLAADFKEKKDYYDNLFGSDAEDSYTYRITVTQTPFEKWRQIGNTFAVPEGVTLSYVRWRKENARWVIDEIGDTGP